MEMGQIGNKVWFALDESELIPYDVTIEQFRDMKPFKEDIVVELAKKAYQKYGKKYEFEGTKMRIETAGNTVYITMTEKSNIIYLDNDYTEEESIVSGLQEMIRFVPDERINLGISDEKEKKRILEKMRSDEGRDLVREYFSKFLQ